MKKKKVALVYGITSNYIDILANVLIGLKKHSKKFWDDIIVYHNGVSIEEQEYIQKILKCQFIEFKEENFVKYIPKEQLKLYSVAAFYRYECFSLLDHYEKVIWSDVDVLYQKDISGLLKYGDKSGYAATYAMQPYKVENNFFELIPEYDMFTPMLNSGLIVLSDKLQNYQEIRDWCYESTIKYGKKLRWPDQGILNLMVQEFKVEAEEIDLNKFHCHPDMSEHVKNAVIIHAHGIRKFWNNIDYQQLFPEWYKNYQEWQKIYPHENPTIYDYQPLVSVIMSVYERYDFLEEAVDSILNQTYKNIEFIIVIEKSVNQDKINKCLNKIKDKRIKIINNNQKLGFPKSLNIAIENSKGKYIARMDDDDISLPNRFMKQVQFMEENNEVGICDTNAEFFMYSSGYWYNYAPSSEEIKALLLVTNPICHPSVMMRKSLLDKYNLRYDNYFSEDYELWSRAAACFPICHIDEVLFNYRASKKNVTSYEDNDIKIQNSVKRTMYHQYKDYLDIDLSSTEIDLLQRRKDLIGNSVCYESAVAYRNELYQKILKQNKKLGFYDQKLLEKIFYIPQTTIPKKHRIKKTIKKIFRPFYRPIMVALERHVFSAIQEEIIYVNSKIDYLLNMHEKEIANLKNKESKKIGKK